MRRTVAALAAAACLPGAAWAQVQPTPIEDAPPPAMLLAQVDDSDLRSEETLKELMQIEYDKDAQSVGAAIALSFIPGAGWGLLYAGKKAQAVVPFTLSAIGYGLAGAYLAGAFDTDAASACAHTRDGKVPFAECGLSRDPVRNKDEDPRADLSKHPPPLNIYDNTAADYSIVTTGEDFDGKETGLLILVGTYAVTTIVGAAWSAAVVSGHNDQLRKDIESTAGIPRPIVGYTGERGVVGVAFDF